MADEENKLLVGPLVEALELPEREVRLSAERRLIPLLGLVGEGDDGCLDSEQCQALRRVLGRSRNPELVCAILRAMAHIGRAADLPAVERLATGRRAVMRDPAVLDAARVCLARLRERLGRPTGEDLLRPATESAHQLSLLRAAHGDCATLGRPAEGHTDAL